MLLTSFLFALAAETPEAMSSSKLIALLAVAGALLAFAIWLISSGKKEPDSLLVQGNRLSMAGQYAEAEQCYREALADESKLKPPLRARLLICLGDALMDLDRYPESRQCLETSLAIGDPRGSCRASLADWLLLQGSDPRRALDLANQAVQASTDGLEEITSIGRIGGHLASIVRADGWARRAWALALLGRQPESQESIDFALKLAAPSLAELSGDQRRDMAATVSLDRTCIYWHTGMALLAMGQTGKAREHFKIASDASPQTRCAARCRQQLERLGTFGG
ncbi:MAG TPA: tetratricopeptide repeat protein [Bryobacteraceae bacterium]|nr:tetratricopeptide repeat protein [Bryobacteraceae bacterium]